MRIIKIFEVHRAIFLEYGKIHSNYVLVTGQFRNAVLKSDLKGFEFIEVWD